MVSTDDPDMNGPWYASWFDSPYYEILYSDRNEDEAEAFLHRLLKVLDPPRGSIMLDLACGKGRYTRFLASKGYYVVGTDLSANNIRSARKYENDHLSFFQHDMRMPFRVNYFDYIFNFFTSFGYFEDEEDNLEVLSHVHKGLKKGGIFVLDYLNAAWVRKNLVPSNTKVVKGISFQLDRHIENDFVVKKIHFSVDGRNFTFQERVKLFTKGEIEKMLHDSGLIVKKLYGNYELAPYIEGDSDRLIFIAEKTDRFGDDYWVGRTDILLD